MVGSAPCWNSGGIQKGKERCWWLVGVSSCRFDGNQRTLTTAVHRPGAEKHLCKTQITAGLTCGRPGCRGGVVERDVGLSRIQPSCLAIDNKGGPGVRDLQLSREDVRRKRDHLDLAFSPHRCCRGRSRADQRSNGHDG